MEFLNKHKKILILVAVAFCILLSVITISFRQYPTFAENALGYIISPTQKGMTGIGRWFERKIYFFTNLSDIENLNESLQLRVAALEAENSRLRLIEIENKNLSELLEIDQKYADYPKVGAEIIARDMGNWYDRFTIDKGKNDGIDKNMVVLGSAGLVGLVVESGDTYSKVISLIDTSSSITAESLRTNDIGFVKGDFDLMELGFCRMEHIDIASQIMEGDEIVTSQLSDIYPPGITIGVVKEIVADTNGLTKHAIIKPVVDFKHLKTVLVAKSNKQAVKYE